MAVTSELPYCCLITRILVYFHVDLRKETAAPQRTFLDHKRDVKSASAHEARRPKTSTGVSGASSSLAEPSSSLPPPSSATPHISQAPPSPSQPSFHDTSFVHSPQQPSSLLSRVLEGQAILQASFQSLAERVDQHDDLLRYCIHLQQRLLDHMEVSYRPLRATHPDRHFPSSSRLHEPASPQPTHMDSPPPYHDHIFDSTTDAEVDTQASAEIRISLGGTSIQIPATLTSPSVQTPLSAATVTEVVTTASSIGIPISSSTISEPVITSLQPVTVELRDIPIIRIATFSRRSAGVGTPALPIFIDVAPPVMSTVVSTTGAGPSAPLPDYPEPEDPRPDSPEREI